MKFWEDNAKLRVLLIVAGFILGMICMYAGLAIKGSLLGVGVMLFGVALLIFALWLYNKPFTE